MNCLQIETCSSDAIERAEELCIKRGVRLTPMRRTVLALIWASHKPVKAYDLLQILQKSNASAKPPTVYRALDFLQEHQLIHKLHTLSAYIGCHTPSCNEDCFFFICTQCKNVTEQHNTMYASLIAQAARSIDFTASHKALEINGTCAHCL